MKNQDFNINNLRVASPCQMPWENMSGDERTRFCQSCKLNVYNVSEMTTSQVRALFVKTEGKFCGRIYKRADGTVLTKDCPVGLRAYYKRTARFAGAVFSSILGLFSISFGQTDSKSDKQNDRKEPVKITRIVSQNSVGILKGIVTDEMGAVIPNAKIRLLKIGTQNSLTTRSDDEGTFLFANLTQGIYELKIEAQAFESLEKNDLNIALGEAVEIEAALKIDKDAPIVGVIGISEETIELRPDKIGPLPIIDKKP